MDSLLCAYTTLYRATERYLAKHGIVAPHEISMICLDPDPAFAWSVPSVSHIYWSSAPVVRRVMRWIGNVARGREDLRNVATPTRFIEGVTIGPVSGR